MNFEGHTIEDMASAARGPIFADQGAISERAFIGAEITEDLINDLDGDVDWVSITLERNSFSNNKDS